MAAERSNLEKCLIKSSYRARSRCNIRRSSLIHIMSAPCMLTTQSNDYIGLHNAGRVVV
jgi:hypothetical protein